jgi:hypothetical protein
VETVFNNHNLGGYASWHCGGGAIYGGAASGTMPCGVVTAGYTGWIFYCINHGS